MWPLVTVFHGKEYPWLQEVGYWLVTTPKLCFNTEHNIFLLKGILHAWGTPGDDFKSGNWICVRCNAHFYLCTLYSEWAEDTAECHALSVITLSRREEMKIRLAILSARSEKKAPAPSAADHAYVQEHTFTFELVCRKTSWRFRQILDWSQVSRKTY